MKTVVLMLAIVLCGLSVSSQSRIPMLGESAPSFKANSTNGTFEFPKDFGNSWMLNLQSSPPTNLIPISSGRNMEEIKRVVVALQTSEKDQVLIPANWNDGDDVLMKYVPYSEQELAANPELANQYYKVGVNLWYKKEGVK